LKYIIAGLGNIGEEYANTRHNVGFKVLDTLAESNSLVFQQDRYASVCEYKFKGKSLILIKPTTYMNLSGKAINYWLQKEKLTAENLFVVVDDLALPFGTIRIRAKGSDGGHNGLINIIQTLGHQNFPRLRFGIGDNFAQGSQINYVLGRWTSEEKKTLPERIDKAVEAIKSFATIGLERTMNFHNKS